MRKQILNYLAILLCISIYSCKKTDFTEKENLTSPASTKEMTIIKKWLATQNTASNQGQTINELIDNLDWSSTDKINYQENTSLITVQLRNNVTVKRYNLNLSPQNKLTENHLIILLNKEGEIVQGTIGQITPKYKKEFYRPSEIVQSILLKKSVPFTGSFTMMSLSKTFLYQLLYYHGKREAEMNVKPLSKKESAQIKTSSIKSKDITEVLKSSETKKSDEVVCWDWYWFTFWSDGSVTAEYMYTECDTPCALATIGTKGSMEAIKVDCVDNSSGGSMGMTNVVVWPGPDKITNINQYMNCFSANGTNCKVSVFVNQPSPGTANIFSFSDVGHSFLAFTQTLPNGTEVTRNVGFYPDGLVTPFNTSKPGELNNDQNSPYNVGIEISISPSNFMSMVNTVTNSTNLPYDLNAGNCVNWAMSVLSSGGVDLISPTPWSTSTFLGTTLFSGYCPGQWGQTIANMSLPNNMTRLSANSAHLNKGNCQ